MAKHVRAVLAHNEGRHSMELTLPLVASWAALQEAEYTSKETLKVQLDALHAKDAKEGRR